MFKEEKVSFGTKILTLDELASYVLARLKNPALPVGYLHPIQQQAVRELTEAPPDKRGTLPSAYKKKNEIFQQTGELPESYETDVQPKSVDEYFMLELKHNLLVGENKPYPEMTKLKLFGFNEQFKRLNGLTDQDMGFLIWVLSRRTAKYVGSAQETFGFDPQKQAKLIEAFRSINNSARGAAERMSLQEPSLKAMPLAQRLDKPSLSGMTLRQILNQFGGEVGLVLKKKTQAIVAELPPADQKFVEYYGKLKLPS